MKFARGEKHCLQEWFPWKRRWLPKNRENTRNAAEEKMTYERARIVVKHSTLKTRQKNKFIMHHKNTNYLKVYVKIYRRFLKPTINIITIFKIL